MNKVSFQTFKLNLFKNSEQKINNNQQNPFAVSFNGNLNKDVFESSVSNEKSQNVLAQKIADYKNKISVSFEGAKNKAKETISPVISFAGRVKNSIQQVSSMNFSDVINNIKEEFKMMKVDREVRGYMKKSVSELREMLQTEIKAA